MEFWCFRITTWPRQVVAKVIDIRFEEPLTSFFTERRATRLNCEGPKSSCLNSTTNSLSISMWNILESRQTPGTYDILWWPSCDFQFWSVFFGISFNDSRRFRDLETHAELLWLSPSECRPALRSPWASEQKRLGSEGNWPRLRLAVTKNAAKMWKMWSFVDEAFGTLPMHSYIANLNESWNHDTWVCPNPFGSKLLSDVFFWRRGHDGVSWWWQPFR